MLNSGLYMKILLKNPTHAAAADKGIGYKGKCKKIHFPWETPAPEPILKDVGGLNIKTSDFVFQTLLALGG